jgi:hypothetical protein
MTSTCVSTRSQDWVTGGGKPNKKKARPSCDDDGGPGPQQLLTWTTLVGTWRGPELELSTNQYNLTQCLFLVYVMFEKTHIQSRHRPRSSLVFSSNYDMFGEGQETHLCALLLPAAELSVAAVFFFFGMDTSNFCTDPTSSHIHITHPHSQKPENPMGGLA